MIRYKMQRTRNCVAYIVSRNIFGTWILSILYISMFAI